MADEFYWCLKHDRVEQADRCGSVWIRGPFASSEAARHYADRAAERNEAWEDADEEWQSWGTQGDTDD